MWQAPQETECMRSRPACARLIPMAECLTFAEQDDCHVVECRCVNALKQTRSMQANRLRRRAGQLQLYMRTQGGTHNQDFQLFLAARPHLFFRSPSGDGTRVTAVTGSVQLLFELLDAMLHCVACLLTCGCW